MQGGPGSRELRAQVRLLVQQPWAGSAGMVAQAQGSRYTIHLHVLKDCALSALRHCVTLLHCV